MMHFYLWRRMSLKTHENSKFLLFAENQKYNSQQPFHQAAHPAFNRKLTKIKTELVCRIFQNEFPEKLRKVTKHKI